MDFTHRLSDTSKRLIDEAIKFESEGICGIAIPPSYKAVADKVKIGSFYFNRSERDVIIGILTNFLSEKYSDDFASLTDIELFTLSNEKVIATKQIDKVRDTINLLKNKSETKEKLIAERNGLKIRNVSFSKVHFSDTKNKIYKAVFVISLSEAFHYYESMDFSEFKIKPFHKEEYTNIDYSLSDFKNLVNDKNVLVKNKEILLQIIQ